MKVFICLSLCGIFSLVSCSKDKNLEDYRRDQIQQSISRITSVSGMYSGSVISKIDGTNLGAITLNFKAQTDIQSSSTQVYNEQTVKVSGSLSLKSLTSAEIVFNNGRYDDTTGEFQVTVPINLDGGKASKLLLAGVVNGDRWNGSIEVEGQSAFGAELDLVRNAPMSNTSAIEVGGSRLQQIKKMSYRYEGSYTSEGVELPVKMSFINSDILPEQKFYRLFSPVRTANINFDFLDFELNFLNANMDDKAGTIDGPFAFSINGTPVRATLNCIKFEENTGDFGWNCSIQTKKTVLNLHLKARR